MNADATTKTFTKEHKGKIKALRRQHMAIATVPISEDFRDNNTAYQFDAVFYSIKFIKTIDSCALCSRENVNGVHCYSCMQPLCCQCSFNSSASKLLKDLDEDCAPAEFMLHPSAVYANTEEQEMDEPIDLQFFSQFPLVANNLNYLKLFKLIFFLGNNTLQQNSGFTVSHACPYCRHDEFHGPKLNASFYVATWSACDSLDMTMFSSAFIELSVRHLLLNQQEIQKMSTDVVAAKAKKERYKQEMDQMQQDHKAKKECYKKKIKDMQQAHEQQLAQLQSLVDDLQKELKNLQRLTNDSFETINTLTAKNLKNKRKLEQLNHALVLTPQTALPASPATNSQPPKTQQRKKTNTNK